MPLAGRAALLHDGHDAGRSRPKDPAGKPAAVEQVVDRGRIRAVVTEGKRTAECQYAVHHLPGPVHGGIQTAAIPGVVQDRVDPATKPAAVDHRAAAIAVVAVVKGRVGPSGAAGRQQQDDQHPRGSRGPRTRARPNPPANRGRVGCVEGSHGYESRCGEGEGTAGRGPALVLEYRRM